MARILPLQAMGLWMSRAAARREDGVERFAASGLGSGSRGAFRCSIGLKAKEEDGTVTAPAEQ